MEATEYLKHWEENQVWTHYSWPQHQQRFKAIVARVKGESFIDVGCAFGHSTAQMKKLHPGNWAGLEFSESAVVKAKQNFPDIDFYFAKDYNILPVCGKFDSVVCSEVIEHVADEDGFIKGLLDVMQERIVVTTPVFDRDDPGHLRIYTEGMLQDLFSGYWPQVKKDEEFWYVVVDLPKGFADKNKAKEILFEISDVLNECNIKHFLTGGVCLAAHREGDFIGTDDDIDISVMIEDFTPKVDLLIERFRVLQYKMEPVRRPLDIIRAIKLDKAGIHTDLVTWLKWKDKRWQPSTWENWCHVHEAKLFDPGEQIDFLGRKFYVPSPITEYLSHNFGESYMTPMIKCPRPSRVPNFMRDNGIRRIIK